MEITLPWAPVKALAHLAAEKDLRPTRNGGAAGPSAMLVTLAGVPEFVGLLQPLQSTEKAPLLVPDASPAWVFDRHAAPAPADDSNLA